MRSSKRSQAPIASSFSKTSVFTRPHVNGVFENLHSGERFRKPPFSLTENAVYVWTQRQNGGKNLRFQKYPHTCERGLNILYRVCTKRRPFKVAASSNFAAICCINIVRMLRTNDLKNGPRSYTLIIDFPCVQNLVFFV